MSPEHKKACINSLPEILKVNNIYDEKCMLVSAEFVSLFQIPLKHFVSNDSHANLILQ